MSKSIYTSSVSRISLIVAVSSAMFLLAGVVAANPVMDVAGAHVLAGVHQAALDCDPNAQICTDGVHRGLATASLDCDPTAQICTDGVHRGLVIADVDCDPTAQICTDGVHRG